MDAVIANVTNLKNKPLAQFLLDIQGPDLRVRSSEIVLNAGDVKGGLRSSGAEAGNANAKRNGRGRNNYYAACRSARVLRQSLFEIVQRNRVVVDSETGPDDGLPAGKDLEGGSPGKV